MQNESLPRTKFSDRKLHPMDHESTKRNPMNRSITSFAYAIVYTRGIEIHSRSRTQRRKIKQSASMRPQCKILVEWIGMAAEWKPNAIRFSHRLRSLQGEIRCSNLVLTPERKSPSALPSSTLLPNNNRSSIRSLLWILRTTIYYECYYCGGEK